MKRVISIFIVIAVTMLIVSGCSKKREQKNTTDITLYFANEQRNNLVEEKRSIEPDKGSELGTQIIKELLKGPQDSSHKAVIPEKTELLSLSIKGTTATINLSSRYYKYSDNEKKDAVELLARYSIVSTLCTLGDVNRVKILIDGDELVNAQGNKVGEISINDIMTGETAEGSTAEKYVTLYFSDSQGEYMYPERRKVELVDNSIEKTIVNELVSGTKSNGLVSLLPPETKVISVETKEGICFVNLSEEFIIKYSGGTTLENMTIYTIVNSLTELETVDKVQFLIEGSKVELYNDMVFSDPFERDDSLIKK